MCLKCKRDTEKKMLKKILCCLFLMQASLMASTDAESTILQERRPVIETNINEINAVNETTNTSNLLKYLGKVANDSSVPSIISSIRWLLAREEGTPSDLVAIGFLSDCIARMLHSKKLLTLEGGIAIASTILASYSLGNYIPALAAISFSYLTHNLLRKNDSNIGRFMIRFAANGVAHMGTKAGLVLFYITRKVLIRHNCETPDEIILEALTEVIREMFEKYGYFSPHGVPLTPAIMLGDE